MIKYYWAILIFLLVACATPITEKQVRQIYLPVIAKPLSMGVAWSVNPISLNGAWSYVAVCDSPCVPQWYDFTQRTDCRQFVLIGNEPDGTIEAGGFPVAVEVAVERSHNLRQQCPDSVFIAGNTIQGDGANWLYRYVAQDGEFDVLGTHCYAPAGWRAIACINALDKFRETFKGNPICLTEWNLYEPDLTTHITEFRELLAYVKKWFSGCSAIYTDYAPPPYEMYALLNADGTRNVFGTLYANR